MMKVDGMEHEIQEKQEEDDMDEEVGRQPCHRSTMNEDVILGIDEIEGQTSPTIHA